MGKSNKSNPRDGSVYELCPKCNGTGTAEHLDGPKPCDACEPIRVVRIANIGLARLNELVKADINKMYDNFNTNTFMSSLRGGRGPFRGGD